jgi:hypothetical protein
MHESAHARIRAVFAVGTPGMRACGDGVVVGLICVVTV